MPQRFLRPGLTTSQRYNSCSWEAQALFTRLITLVDDFGRYDAEPRLLRSHAFPFGDPVGKDIVLPKLKMMCEQLSISGLVDFYETPDGKKYLQVSRWQERTRAEKSKYPAFDNTCQQMFGNDNKCSLPSSPSPSSSPPSPASRRHSSEGSGKPNASEPSDEVWLVGLTRSPAYEGIDVKREHARMVIWCGEHKKQPTRRRFIRWLNKTEKPLRIVPKAQLLDPAKIELPTEFREWAGMKYQSRQAELSGYQTWADVPEWMRAEWKREKISPLTKAVAV